MADPQPRSNSSDGPSTSPLKRARSYMSSLFGANDETTSHHNRASSDKIPFSSWKNKSKSVRSTSNQGVDEERLLEEESEMRDSAVPWSDEEADGETPSEPETCELFRHAIASVIRQFVMKAKKTRHANLEHNVTMLQKELRQLPMRTDAIIVTQHGIGQFAELRKIRSVGDLAFIAELAKPIQILGKLGKSGSMLAFSASQHYVVKVIPSKEANHLMKILPHVSSYCADGCGKYMSQTLALLQVKTQRHGIRRFQKKSIFFAVQEVCYPKLSEKPLVFDLKGSWVARTTKTAPGQPTPRGVILKDNNLTKLIDDRQNFIQIPAEEAQVVLSALRADSQLLARCECLDYSLLLVMVPASAIDHTQPSSNLIAPPIQVKVEGVPHLAFLRIIDTLCPWSTKKRAAQVIKVIRGNSKLGLSTMPPREYANRFMATCASVLFRPS
eukprot:m.115509 g.115509  ORF g.115509 m.115509 type:complete len:442 (+) comp28429_c0_seq1:111-1436(+)